MAIPLRIPRTLVGITDVRERSKMWIGVPKEIKSMEGRVALHPAGVQKLVEKGHQVLVQNGAGLAAGFTDFQYLESGAILVQNPESLWGDSDLVLKVKEPQPKEFEWLRSGLKVFAYLHLAANSELRARLLDQHVTAFAFEDVRESQGLLPLLAPMSRIAGRLSVQLGAQLLQNHQGGRGVLLGGDQPGRVVVLGAGQVGQQAVEVALGMGAKVTVLDLDPVKLHALQQRYPQAEAVVSKPTLLEAILSEADLCIGAVLIPGRAAPKILTRELIRTLPTGAVFVDVSIDQGGCAETSRPTTHEYPSYIEEGVVHACVANLPGCVPRTSSMALIKAHMPYLMELVDLNESTLEDWSIRKDRLGLAAGLVSFQGRDCAL